MRKVATNSPTRGTMMHPPRLYSSLCVLISFQIILYFSLCCSEWDCARRNKLIGDIYDFPSGVLAPSSSSRRIVEEDKSSNSNVPWKIPVQDNGTAVVVTLSYLDGCEAVRLKHLVDTSGLDVWVLHGHDKFRSKYPSLVNASERLIKSIPGLHSWPQVSAGMDNFDSKISGSTKSSFLKFLIHHPQYHYGWHVESDVFYTGMWNKVLLPTSKNDTADFVYGKQWPKYGNDTWWNRVGNGTCHVDKFPCWAIHPMQTYWMVARASRRLAKALIASLETNKATGHHEGMIAAFCKKRGFRTRRISPHLVGDPFHCGNTVPYQDRGAEKRLYTLGRKKPPMPSRLYHPVKCVAYTSGYVMQAEIEQWLK